MRLLLLHSWVELLQPGESQADVAGVVVLVFGGHTSTVTCCND